MKKLSHIIVALVVALSLAIGATSAAAAPGPVRPMVDRDSAGITWQ